MNTSSITRAGAFGAGLIFTVAIGSVGTAGVTGAVPVGPGCPALYVLGIQGTGQSSPTTDPLTDTGVVGALLGPVLEAAPGLVQRSYIPYAAGFGGAVPGGGSDPYAVSVADGHARLDAAADEIAGACPGTLIAGVGYSQGAQAMSMFAHDIGSGHGPVAADRIAGIALYADPARAPHAPTFPGRPGQTVPDPAPGTSGVAVSTVRIANPEAGGGGIAAIADDYGALTGRVVEICTDGDVTCSAPDRAALLRFGAEIAAQADLRNPIAALGSIHALLSTALGDAWTTVVNEDVDLGVGAVDYLPQQSLAARLIEATDPRTPALDPEQYASAASRWNELTATVAANPILLPGLAGQLAAAWGGLVADNADLIDPAVWIRFADTATRHNTYASTGQLDSGIAWMVALAHDAGSRE